MNLKILIFLFLITTIFAGCRNQRSTEEKPTLRPMHYKVGQRSQLFNEKNISFTLDSGGNTLYINLAIKALKHFPFPINKQFHDTLFKTVFNFSMGVNGVVINSEYNSLKNRGWGKDTNARMQQLVFASDTIDLRSANEISFEVPMYVFHQLKKGNQKIGLKMSQSLFTDELHVVRPDSSMDYEHLYATKPLLSGSVIFDMNVPPIYKSIVYGYGLELRNDSTFSPAGMDNTIWKSSYPDIYWSIYYPVNSFYTKTDYETSTDKYVAHDTFNVYHYYADDSIGLGVYDHDNLSRDDIMGYWTGPLEKLEKAPISRIAFGDIKWFDVKVVEKGIVN
jgi:hypothetical protein